MGYENLKFTLKMIHSFLPILIMILAVTYIRVKKDASNVVSRGPYVRFFSATSKIPLEVISPI